MIKHKVNYVIATWGGPRNERGFIVEDVLRKHIEIVRGFKNKVSKITVVSPFGPHLKIKVWNDRPGFVDLINQLDEDDDIDICEEKRGPQLWKFFLRFWED